MLVGWLALAACIRDIPRGPDLGPCAVLPEGTYGYGDAGIGTCLAGPADLRFFEQDGGQFLAVTNSDPYREFSSGSVLIVDFDDLEQRFLDAERPERISMDQLATHAFTMLDDDDGDGIGSNPFFGGFGYLPEHQAAVVASRYSETGVLRTGRDEAFVLDLRKMELVNGGVALAQTLELEDDPQPVVVDSANQRVYVGNLSDHSVSVLSSAPLVDDPRPEDILREVDVAVGTTSTEAALDDADATGSLAEVTTLEVTDRTKVVSDAWTLGFVEQTARLWVPTPLPSGSGTGVHLYSTGDTRSYVSSAFPFDTGLGIVEAPFVELGGGTGLPEMTFARTVDGNVYRAVASPYGDGEWVLDTNAVLSRPDTAVGSPSLAPVPEGVGLFVQEWQPADYLDRHSFVSLAVSADGVSFDYLGPVLSPVQGASYEDPFVVADPKAGRWRMWLTVRRGDTTEVALAESDDGQSWSAPVPILPNTDRWQYAAPTVLALEGRYGMWVARTDGTVWDTAFAWSYDGWSWTEPVGVLPGVLPFPGPPPRVGGLADLAGGWRLEGANSGSVTGLLTAGAAPVPLAQFDLALTNGHELPNGVVPDRQADTALVPGSAIDLGGVTYLFATAVSDGGTERIVVLERGADGWTVAVTPDQMADRLGLSAGEGASDPVVAQDGDGWVLFYSRLARNGTARIRRATSSDGLVYGTTEAAAVLPESEDSEFDATTQKPHSIEVLSSGYRLWYTGFDGSTSRIGTATAGSLRDRFARDPGDVDPWRLGPGTPGGFDDSSVKDPLVVHLEVDNGDGTTRDEAHLYFAGYDGEVWRIGHALLDGATPTVRTDLVSGLPVVALGALDRTYLAHGAESPVLLGAGSVDGQGAADHLELAVAGSDGIAWRTGLARVPLRAPDEVYAAQRFPTAGDTMTFETARGGPGAQVVELGQITESFSALGYGMSAMALDEARGFLYVTSKLDDALYVVDVRDDTAGDFVDANYLDLESYVQIDSGSTVAGYRDVVVSPTRGLAYLTQRNPDGLVILDLSRLVDDGTKELAVGVPVAVLPLQSQADDLGVDTYAQFGGAGMALTADEQFLLVTHFKSNALSVFDLDRGPWGEEIAWLPNLGENPHVVRVSPDGRYAVVANYLGDVAGQTVSSTLVVVDLDPNSPTYLEAVTWLGNH